MSDTPKTPQVDTDYFDQALEIIRTKLLDTTRRNRLLNYRESARDIAVIDEMPDQIHEHLVLDGKRFRFDSREETEDDPALYPGEDGLPLLKIPDTAEVTADSASRELPASATGGASVAPRHSDDLLQTDHSEKDLARIIREEVSLLN
ncbi:MAG: hypothetical protein CME06_01160 [Gemmatimonadetes bacterium]|nr:hypothetical protein [Gemmatimonadota bacterium]